jgi:hypothetical protein
MHPFVKQETSLLIFYCLAPFAEARPAGHCRQPDRGISTTAKCTHDKSIGDERAMTITKAFLLNIKNEMENPDSRLEGISDGI